MASILDIVNNQLLQEGVSSNPFLRRQMLRKMSQDTSYDEAPKEATQPTQTYDTSTNYEGGDSTLASTYSKLLNNYRALGGNTSSSGGGTTQTNTYDPNGSHLNIPSWAPAATSVGFGLARLPQVGAIASAAESLVGGDEAGGMGKLASLFTNNVTEGKYPGLGSLVGTLTKGLVHGDSVSEIGGNLLNTGIGSALSAANPVLGLGYGLAKLFGLDVARGLSSWADSRDYASLGGHQGGFFTDRSEYNGYTPGQAYEPGTNQIINNSGGSNGVYGQFNTGYGSGFDSSSWGSGLSGSTSDDSGSDY